MINIPSSGNIVVIDIETIAEPFADDPSNPLKFPPTWACKIVCIGWAIMTKNKVMTSFGHIKGEEEKILIEFSKMMFGSPNIVTYNGRRFDIPVIQMRSFKHGVPMPWLLESKYRYGTFHTDLYDHLSIFGAHSPGKLDDLCVLIGLPGKGEIDGASVGKMWEEGNISAICHYCESDVVQTAILYIHYEMIVGKMSKDRYIAKKQHILDMWARPKDILSCDSREYTEHFHPEAGKVTGSGIVFMGMVAWVFVLFYFLFNFTNFADYPIAIIAVVMWVGALFLSWYEIFGDNSQFRK